jgi:hypothetical protein
MAAAYVLLPCEVVDHPSQFPVSTSRAIIAAPTHGVSIEAIRAAGARTTATLAALEEPGAILIDYPFAFWWSQ